MVAQLRKHLSNCLTSVVGCLHDNSEKKKLAQALESIFQERGTHVKCTLLYSATGEVGGLASTVFAYTAGAQLSTQTLSVPLSLRGGGFVSNPPVQTPTA